MLPNSITTIPNLKNIEIQPMFKDILENFECIRSEHSRNEH